jgi:hypothetical protein
MDDRLDAMYERFTWRILSNYVSPWEFEQLKQEVTDYEQWCGAWSAQARTHVDRADAEAAAGRRLTAGDGYLRAGLLYHWASFMFSHDQDQYRAALQAMSAVWRKAAPLLDPPMRILEVPFEDLILPGYLRVPSGVTRPPVVIMFPGGDSVKEELYNLGEYIVTAWPPVTTWTSAGSPSAASPTAACSPSAPPRSTTGSARSRPSRAGIRRPAGLSACRRC